EKCDGVSLRKSKAKGGTRSLGPMLATKACASGGGTDEDEPLPDDPLPLLLGVELLKRNAAATVREKNPNVSSTSSVTFAENESSWPRKMLPVDRTTSVMKLLFSFVVDDAALSAVAVCTVAFMTSSKSAGGQSQPTTPKAGPVGLAQSGWSASKAAS